MPLAQNGVFGALLLAVAAVGVAAAVLRAHRSGDRAVAALPVGLTAAWLTFAVLPSLTRAEATSAFGFGGRLLHVSAALTLPLVAAGAEELARRRTALGVAALVPLAVGVPGNLDRLSETSILFKSNRQVTYAVAHSRSIDDVPANLRPLQDNGFRPPATAEWLARQADAGGIPGPNEPVPPDVELGRRVGWF